MQAVTTSPASDVLEPPMCVATSLPQRLVPSCQPVAGELGGGTVTAGPVDDDVDALVEEGNAVDHGAGVAERSLVGPHEIVQCPIADVE